MQEFPALYQNSQSAVRDFPPFPSDHSHSSDWPANLWIANYNPSVVVAGNSEFIQENARGRVINNLLPSSEWCRVIHYQRLGVLRYYDVEYLSLLNSREFAYLRTLGIFCSPFIVYFIIFLFALLPYSSLKFDFFFNVFYLALTTFYFQASFFFTIKEKKKNWPSVIAERKFLRNLRGRKNVYENASTSIPFSRWIF